MVPALLQLDLEFAVVKIWTTIPVSVVADSNVVHGSGAIFVSQIVCERTGCRRYVMCPYLNVIPARRDGYLETRREFNSVE